MPAIEVRQLRKRYGNTIAADGIDLTVAEGEILGVLGRNGAGKTTTVESIAGIRRPDEGTVRVLGMDPYRDREVRRVLGVQLQEAQLHQALTVNELLRLHGSFHPDGADPARLLADVNLTAQGDVRFERLSGGQQQRLSIALALLGNPRVVVLDELTTGLDPEARRGIWDLVDRIRADGVAVVLVSHLMEEVERLCDRVTLIDAGRVIATDTPEGLIATARLGQRVTFRAADFDPAVLEGLDSVAAVSRDDDRVTVHGRGNLLQTVSTALVSAGVVATETRLRQPTLDDAFLALTGHTLTETEPTR